MRARTRRSPAARDCTDTAPRSTRCRRKRECDPERYSLLLKRASQPGASFSISAHQAASKPASKPVSATKTLAVKHSVLLQYTIGPVLALRGSRGPSKSIDRAGTAWPSRARNASFHHRVGDAGGGCTPCHRFAHATRGYTSGGGAHHTVPSIRPCHPWLHGRRRGAPASPSLSKSLLTAATIAKQAPAVWSCCFRWRQCPLLHCSKCGQLHCCRRCCWYR